MLLFGYILLRFDVSGSGLVVRFAAYQIQYVSYHDRYQRLLESLPLCFCIYRVTAAEAEDTAADMVSEYFEAIPRISDSCHAFWNSLKHLFMDITLLTD